MQKISTVKDKNVCSGNIRLNRYVDFNTMVYSIIGFLLSRAMIIDSISPLGLAFFICLIRIDKYKVPVFISVLIGILTSPNDIAHITRYVVTLILFMVISKKIKKINSELKLSSVCTALMVPIILGQFLTSDMTIYNLFLSLAELVIIFIAICTFPYGIKLINSKNNKISVKTEESISLAMLMTFSIIGIGEIVFFDISIRTVMATVLILISSIVGGPHMGATSGVIVGISFLINNMVSSIYMGVYAFAGLIGGAFSKVNKYLCIIGYVLSWIIIYAYTSGINSNMMELRDILISALIVILLPSKAFDKVANILKSNLVSNDVVNDYILRNKDITNTRLVNMYKTYDELANTFDRVRERDKVLDNRDIASVIDMIHSDECRGCGLNRMCWESKFQHTYSMIYKILEVLEDKGHATINDIPKDFKKECLRAEPILKVANYYYKMFVLDYNWNVKFSESRRLISDQIRSISKSIENMCRDFEDNIILDIEKEKNISEELDRCGIDIDKVSYTTSGKDEFDICIDKSTCSNGKACDDKILDIVSSFTGETLTMQKMGCNCFGDKCKIKFTKAQKYKAVTNVSNMSRDGHILCGDNFTHMDINDGKYMVAISDGMGKGKKAYEESSVTIDILEKMMDAKIDDEIVINTINNMLILKSTDEMFSTLDLGIIDLKKGGLDTIKMGACSTYIKRDTGDIDLISSSSLPVGIIGDVKLDRQHTKIKDGDYIIMVSDGIIDAGKNKDLGDNWLIYFIQNIETTNPKEISNLILDRALDLQNGSIEDDMTALVTKICVN